MKAYYSCILIICMFLIDRTTCGEVLTFLTGNQDTSEGYIETLKSNIRLKAYNGSSMEDAVISDIPVVDAELIYSHIDRSKPLVLYIHGFSEHPSNGSVQTMIGVHLRRGTDNIMLVDWSDLALGNYVTVANRVRAIAAILARTFDHLVLLGLDLETFHVVGHSLGAQIAGFMGKFSNNTIPRITGLDPAGPGFSHLVDHIDASSARFVDIIHTDGGMYGALSSTGSVDFRANGGIRYQPGCPLFAKPFSDDDFCSHGRSWRYYAESVLNEHAFPAVQCSSNIKFLLGACRENRRVYFGYATPTDARGSFYFKTNKEPPFSKNSFNEPSQDLATGDF